VTVELAALAVRLVEVRRIRAGVRGKRTAPPRSAWQIEALKGQFPERKRGHDS
jgi:hypothetical protein